ncbi:MAG TPA: antitoxin Xre/MbcA/ParS toxin-binding domain-containing protein [Sphingobacteriaceae bacterium]|nr:antitoxin Xre/MbcA/ParS toxin-binding domain-containing protein [Sphingobacteriaceae bacterium]
MAKIVDYKNLESDLEDIPMLQDFAKVYLRALDKGSKLDFFKALDELTGLGDQVLADWLNITTRTLHNYRTKSVALKPITKEHIVLLLSLYRNGIRTFGNKEDFEQWLSTKNVYLEQKAPKDVLVTFSGIRMVDHMLTVIKYGDII